MPTPFHQQINQISRLKFGLLALAIAVSLSFSVSLSLSEFHAEVGFLQCTEGFI